MLIIKFMSAGIFKKNDVIVEIKPDENDESS